MKGRCLRCDTALNYRWQRVCSPCSHRRSLVVRYLSGGILAQNEVAKARRRGALPDPHDFPCADCGCNATEYDHRDYNEPLKVDPVCRGCNARRGRAAPKYWTPNEWREYAARCIEYARTPFYVRPSLLRDIRHDEAIIFGPPPKSEKRKAAA